MKEGNGPRPPDVGGISSTDWTIPAGLGGEGKGAGDMVVGEAAG